jgi:hypothetical protein
MIFLGMVFFALIIQVVGFIVAIRNELSIRNI